MRRVPVTGPDRPFRTAVLVSATGPNLRTLLRLQDAEPEVLQVCLVASHAPDVPALQQYAEMRQVLDAAFSALDAEYAPAGCGDRS